MVLEKRCVSCSHHCGCDVANLCRHCRLERAVLETISNEPDSVKTPDIGGTGTTRSFVNSIVDKL